MEAGERLGFLPGDLTQKVDPYLRPMYDALYEMMGFDRVARLIERNVIEVAPLAFMRGRSLNESFIILDEAQNTTPEQMKMFLTRIGFGSRAVVTGDVTQTDLPAGRPSGLRHVIDLLRGVEGVAFSWFDAGDIVRHPLVQRIVQAYEARSGTRTHDRGAPLVVECVAPARMRAPSRRALAGWASAALGRAALGRELALKLVSQPQMRALNRQFRGKDKPTNVLAFPAMRPRRARTPQPLGDVVICPAVLTPRGAARRARRCRRTGRTWWCTARCTWPGLTTRTSATRGAWSGARSPCCGRWGSATPIATGGRPWLTTRARTQKILRRIRKFTAPKDRAQLRELLRNAAARGPARRRCAVDGRRRAGCVGPAGARHHGAAQPDDLRARRRPPQHILSVAIDSGHSRFPVLEPDGEKIIGILLAKDLLRLFTLNSSASFDIRDWMRKALFVPESKRVNVLLKELRMGRNHMAICRGRIRQRRRPGDHRGRHRADHRRDRRRVRRRGREEHPPRGRAPVRRAGRDAHRGVQ